ncbi:LysR family transcriptional regulator [Endothiovibrio diazotrophicus]
MIDLNEMTIFVKVVEAGTFTGAARALALPKSTVSRKVAALEERLGVRLLQRTTRQVTLTELGAAYYERCARVVQEAEEAERVVSHSREAPCGRLRLSAPVELAEWLGGAITDYLVHYPQVEVELDLTHRYVNLVEEGFDLVLRGGQLADSTLIARRLYTSRLVVCATATYLAQHGEPDTPRALKEHDCLLHGGPEPLHFSGSHGATTVTLQPRLRANNLHLIRNAALAHLGVAIIPDDFCRRELSDGRLVELLRDWSLPEGGLYAVYPSPRHLTPKVRNFLELLTERIERSDTP